MVPAVAFLPQCIIVDTRRTGPVWPCLCRKVPEKGNSRVRTWKTNIQEQENVLIMLYRIKTYYLLAMACMLLTFAAASTVGAAVKMPAFALPSAVDGKVVKSSSFRGKAMLVTFFATWCPPCRQEIPTLKKLQEEFGDKGFSVVGLSVDEGGPRVVAKLVKQEAINYPVLMADRATANDFGGIAGIPTSFLINRKGNVVKRYPGYVPHALLVKDIQSIL